MELSDKETNLLMEALDVMARYVRGEAEAQAQLEKVLLESLAHGQPWLAELLKTDDKTLAARAAKVRQRQDEIVMLRAKIVQYRQLRDNAGGA